MVQGLKRNSIVGIDHVQEYRSANQQGQLCHQMKEAANFSKQVLMCLESFVPLLCTHLQDGPHRTRVHTLRQTPISNISSPLSPQHQAIE